MADVSHPQRRVRRYDSERYTFPGDGSLEVSFDALAGASRYNLYFGRLSTARTGGYEHGAGAPIAPSCAAPTQDVGGGRLEILLTPGQQPGIDGYFLVTAHVDDVESPSGFQSNNPSGLARTSVSEMAGRVKR